MLGFIYAVLGPHWFSKLEELLVNAPCSNNTSLSCAWLQLQCDGGQVSLATSYKCSCPSCRGP